MVDIAPGGTEIAKFITTNHREGDTNISDVSQMLVRAHERRPGVWSDDLARTNRALRDAGILPGVNIVGVKGPDLIIRDNKNHLQIVDSTNVTRRVDLTNGTSQREIGGRAANIAPDGSGTVTAGRNDRYEWVLAKSILQGQGLANPTPNQIANYQMEIEKLNGRRVDKFKPGEQIQIPPTTRAADGSVKPATPVGARTDKPERPAPSPEQQQEIRAAEFRARMQTRLDALEKQFSQVADRAKVEVVERERQTELARQQALAAQKARVESSTRAWFYREGNSTAITPAEREREQRARALEFTRGRE